MSQLISGKKKSEIKIEKENYLRHLSRLEKLKEGKSPDQLRRQIQSRKLSATISNLRRMHVNNRKFKQKQSKQLERKTHFDNFNRVKSVVKDSFSKEPLPIASKHKTVLRPIHQQNQRMLDRLINVRSQFDFRSERHTLKHFRKNGNQHTLDFSQFYNTSRLNKYQESSFKISFGRSKQNIRITLDIEGEEFLQIFKDHDSLYAFEATYGDMTRMSKKFLLSDYANFKLDIKIPKKYYGHQKLNIRLNKILDQRDITKGEFTIQESDLSPCNTQIQELLDKIYLMKQVRNSKGKPQGVISICISQKQHKELVTIYDPPKSQIPDTHQMLVHQTDRT